MEKDVLKTFVNLGDFESWDFELKKWVGSGSQKANWGGLQLQKVGVGFFAVVGKEANDSVYFCLKSYN